MTRSGGWLVVRRHGGLWAVNVSAVRGVSSSSGEVSIQVVGGRLRADELVDLEPGLRVRPAGRVSRAYLPHGSWGLAMSGTGPAVVIDPVDPPIGLKVTEERPG